MSRTELFCLLENSSFIILVICFLLFFFPLLSCSFLLSFVLLCSVIEQKMATQKLGSLPFDNVHSMAKHLETCETRCKIILSTIFQLCLEWPSQILMMLLWPQQYPHVICSLFFAIVPKKTSPVTTIKYSA